MLYLHLVRGLPTALTTTGDASWNQALKWIENCRSHPLCGPVQTANAQDKWPARLVAVGSVGDAQVRICETSRLGFVEKSYMTLSHCWGKNGVPTRLMEENYARFLNGIQLGQLPKTFRDAINVTRKLKIPFIWIDSLCIIQDSYEDWIQESAKMQQVYQNSFLNLAAGASLNSKGGLFYQRHPLSVVPWSVRLGANGYLTAKHISEYCHERYAKLNLNTRGWVLQEQLLARRTLVFGRKELHWECSTCQASETFPDPKNRPTPKWVETISRRDWQFLLGDKLVDSKRQEAWNRLTRTYFERSLTHASDRLVAISGLAEQLSSRWTGIGYLAGLWSYCLIQGLLWSCEPPCSQRNMEIAPSWSWASLIQPCQSGQPSKLLTCNPQTVDILAEVLKASATPKSRTNPFGPITFGGSIKLRSPVLRANITAFSDKSDEYFLKCGDDCNLDALEFKYIRLNVCWDEVYDVRDDVQDAYLVPFVIKDRGMKTLVGLIILKTAVHCCKTQFRRAGYFYIDSFGWNKESLFKDIELWFAEKVGDSLEKRMGYLEKDPYVNGPPLNTNLENRYLTESGRDLLPDISRFLKAISWVAKHNKANGTPDPVLGFGEGNGYYTYEIV